MLPSSTQLQPHLEEQDTALNQVHHATSASKFKSSRDFAIIIFIIISFTAGLFYNYFNKPSPLKPELIDETSPLPSNDGSFRYTTPIPRKQTVWNLIRDPQGAYEKLTALSGDGYDHILRWQDWLLYGGHQIFAHNLSTGQTQKIFDISQQKDKEEYTTLFEITEFAALQDTLIFSFGGYLAPGATYGITLPPDKHQVVKLTDGSNQRVENIQNRYWLIGGEGDACWGYQSYSLLNFNPLSATDVATSEVGCSEGEEFIAFDNRNRMILAYHGTENKSENTQVFNSWSENFYRYIIAVPLDNPVTKKGIIARQNMPAGITDVFYSPDRDQLVLVGEAVYLYDFESQSLDQIMSVPPDFQFINISQWQGDLICGFESFPYDFDSQGKSPQEKIALNLNSKTITPNYENCLTSDQAWKKEHPEENQDEPISPEHRIEQLKQQLNLPSQYQLMKNEVEISY